MKFSLYVLMVCCFFNCMSVKSVRKTFLCTDQTVGKIEIQKFYDRTHVLIETQEFYPNESVLIFKDFYKVINGYWFHFQCGKYAENFNGCSRRDTFFEYNAKCNNKTTYYFWGNDTIDGKVAYKYAVRGQNDMFFPSFYYFDPEYHIVKYVFANDTRPRGTLSLDRIETTYKKNYAWCLGYSIIKPSERCLNIKRSINPKLK